MIRNGRALRAGIALALSGAATLGAAAPAGADARLWASTYVGNAAESSVEAWFDNGHPGRLDVIRGGSVIATDTGAPWYSGTHLQLAVQSGDELVFTDRQTGAVYRATVTGRPTLDASVCGSPTSVAGTRDTDGAIQVGASLYYGPYDSRNAYRQGSLSTLAGERFGGTFSNPIGAPWVVFVTQTRRLASDFTFTTQLRRLVGNCPPPSTPGPVTPPADTTRPRASVLLPKNLLAAGALYRSLRAGLISTTVKVNEPSTIKQVLYLGNGAKLPGATAAAKKRVVLGSGRAVATKPGAVKVKIKLSKTGRTRVRRARSLKVVLVTTVRDTAGNTTILPAKRLTAKRTKAKR